MPPTETKNRSILKSAKKINPADQLKQSIRNFLIEVGQVSDEDIEKLIQEVPHKWERHGDLIVIPQRSLKDESWKLFGK
jgi:isocitrate dehydrogenase kinase/phosphatase